MPRQSSFRVVLSKGERQHLSRSRANIRYRIVMLFAVKIIPLASQGLSNDVIASRLRPVRFCSSPVLDTCKTWRSQSA